MNKYTDRYKIVLLGASGVGKSSISLRYVRNDYSQDNESTIGAAFLTMPIDFGDKKICLEIWDTAGQERYNSLAPMYYRGSSAAIIVYDITCPDSLILAKRWIKEIQSTLNDCFIILVGNKLDIEHLRQVSYGEANEYAYEQNITYIETSAKSSHNVNKVFDIILKNLPISKNINNDESITQINPIKIKKSCACN